MFMGILIVVRRAGKMRRMSKASWNFEPDVGWSAGVLHREHKSGRQVAHMGELELWTGVIEYENSMLLIV